MDVWVDDMEGDWDDDWEAIPVGGEPAEADNRPPLAQRLAPVPLVPIPGELVSVDNLTNVVPVETLVIERTAADK